MKNITSILFVLFLLLYSFIAFGQGCVAVRPGGACMLNGHQTTNNSTSFLSKGQWQISANYRYFKSFRHYRGDIEQKERIENGTQVFNISNSIDFNLSYALNSRLAVSLNLPIIDYDRSSLYEHYGNSKTSNPDQLRFHTGGRGIGDVRLSVNYWLFDPEKAMNGNIAIGIGVKAPSGNYNVQDEFHSRLRDGKDSIAMRAVDQSIQLGDGGWGINVEIQGFQRIFGSVSMYFNGFYLSNPRNVNTTLTRGTLRGIDPIIAYHSVADQFAARLGLNFQPFPKKSLLFSLGGRIEGVPAHDIIGKSEGFRRPGYIVSLEPSLTYFMGKSIFALNMPLAMYRNRIKSVYDLADPKGERHGDAAFADYLLSASFIYRF